MRSFPMLLLPFLCTGACTWFHSEDHVLVTSDPPGARIEIDGIDTGRTTPARLPIAGTFGADHAITLSKRGFRPRTGRVYQHTEGYTSKWIDGVYDEVMPPLPLFWTPGDFVFPFGVRSAIVPHELHVKLYRTEEPKLGFEVLAERSAAAAATGGK
jgi:hypothetical protein